MARVTRETDGMHIRPLLRTLAVSATLLAVFAPASASSVNIDITQTSAIQALGTWTLLKPTQDSVAGQDATKVLSGLDAGHYTLIDQPPSGTTVHITLERNGVKEQTVDYPQITFDANDGDAVSIGIRYELTNTGKVGVNSDPSGVRFTLRGPNDLLRDGVTPASYEGMAIGNYSVQYWPDGGCTNPAPKSALLQKDSAVYFSVTIRCETLKTVAKPEESDTLSADVNGATVTFTDVAKDAWYAPFAGAVARQGIITGYTDETGKPTGLYGPMNTVTVVELAKIAHIAAGIDEHGYGGQPRNPAAVGQWFTRYVADAENRGWSIYTDDADLARPVTRAEVLDTLLHALDIPLRWAKGGVFQDVTMRTPYASAVETAHALGIADGATDENGALTGMFHPLDPINRAEMAKLLITIQEMRKKQAAGSSSSGR
jgi:hypothetical protein